MYEIMDYFSTSIQVMCLLYIMLYIFPLQLTKSQAMCIVKKKQS